MPLRNIHRPVTEAYDPKQRIVGGIVLFLLMLLIYSILKLVLGFSSASEGEYILPQKKRDEVSAMVDSNNNALQEAANIQSSQEYDHLLPKGFVFLNLDGTPIQPEIELPTEEIIPPVDVFGNPDNEGKWYVQAASFKTESQAQRLVRQIKAKNIASTVYVLERSGWYAVRLHPEDERNTADQQSQKLRKLLYLKPMVKRIN